MNIDRQIDDLNQRYREHTDRVYRPAILGKADGTLKEPSVLGYYYIREYTDNGLSSPRLVLLPAGTVINLAPGTAIRLGKDVKGNEVIKGADTAATLAANVDTGSTVPLQPGQGGSGASGVAGSLVVTASATPDMNVSVASWNPIPGNTAYQFGGAVVPLVAPSALMMYYAIVFVLADLSGTEVVYSTQRSVADLPLGLADRQEGIDGKSPGSTPVWAIKLVGGQTAITQSDIDSDGKDLRQLVNSFSMPIPDAGIVSLVLGVATISTTLVTANSLIFLTPQESGVITGFLKVSARAAGVSFSIASSVLTDTATVAWQIVEP